MRSMLKYLWLVLLLLAACRSKIPQPTLEIVSSDGLQETRDTIATQDFDTALAAVQADIAKLTSSINNSQTNSQTQQQLAAMIPLFTQTINLLKEKDSDGSNQDKIAALEQQLSVIQSQLGQQQTDQTSQTDQTGQTTQTGTQQTSNQTATGNNQSTDNAAKLTPGSYLYLNSVKGAMATEIEDSSTNEHKSHPAEIREDVKDGDGKAFKITGYGNAVDFPETVAIHFDGNQYINIITAKVLALEVAISSAIKSLNPSKALNLDDEKNAKDIP